MARLAAACAVLCASWAMVPGLVHAGGREFPGDGTRAMGRGGAGMTRADSPRTMVRNPALLADLPSTMLEVNWAVTMPDACFEPSGGYGLRVDQTATPDVIQLPGEDRPLYLDDYYGEPYPEVCYEGGYVFLPNVIIGGHLSDDLGWALGFVPPDLANLAQWGDRDGTVMTPNGRRPSPTRYTGVHQNATFFSLQGGIGYRIAPWLRIGAGVRWSMVVFQGATIATALANSRKAANDAYGELTGRDLFIPGFTVSVHAVPTDNIDVALGFRWEDSMKVTSPKLDVITNVWGPGHPVPVNDNGMVSLAGAGLAVSTYDIGGTFETPPLIVPQLSFSVRYADRIVPRDRSLADDEHVGDSLDTERWDIELDAVYYLSSVIDEQVFTFKQGEGRVVRQDLLPDGSVTTLNAYAGKCLVDQPDGICPISRQNIRPLGGRDQWSFRLGSDVNLVPGRFALRAGFSFEQRGIDPNQAFTGNNANLQRTGLHAGATLRFGMTDFTVSYAHFFTETVVIAFSGGERTADWREPEYRPYSRGDAAAYAELPDNDNQFGVLSVNAGRQTQSIGVIAVGLAQHF